MKCYEYFSCNEMNCIAHFDDRHCWQIDSVECYKREAEHNQNILKHLKGDQTICDNCPYRNEIFNSKKKTI
jgi:hypothetical protein